MNKSEKFWDKAAKNFDSPSNKRSDSYIRVIENTKKYLKSEDIVLDFACGTGQSTIDLAGFAREIKAIDSSDNMIKSAKSKLSWNNVNNITFTKASIFDEIFKKESFSVVLAFNIIHLLEEQQKTIKRISDLLKPGGYFISSTPCIRNKKLLKLLIAIFSKIGVVPYVNWLNNKELENLITNEGFKIIESEKLPKDKYSHFIVAEKL